MEAYRKQELTSFWGCKHDSVYGRSYVCTAVAESEGAVEVAEDGDLVAVHYRLKTEDGQLLDSSEGREPLTFEIGAGDVVGNPLYQSFDSAARGLAVGEVQIVKSRAGEWNEDMLFEVPRDHEEVLRLEAIAAQSPEGPLQTGSVVELVNGEPAIIVSMDEKTVRIDANHPLAGTMLDFEVEIIAIQKGFRSNSVAAT
eukprot:TRINITY_DN527_c0_g1_i1.p1 TRINITY_DN527_c0_g1~~TRINITY_DN527_c0_g1_i1.p1  ORF type:complete len:198 (-),score=38.54 TRINITY_DN527_c0_g1_i1:200-793(-)